MFHEKVSARPLILWLLCAMTAPAAQLLAGQDPLLLGLVALACTAVACISLAGSGQPGKYVAILQFLWTAVAVGVLAEFTAASWPMGKESIAVPLVLLGLAAWSASKGPAAAAGAAGVLFLLLCVGYGLIFLSAAPQLRGEWALAQQQAEPGLAVFLLLIPVAAACLFREELGKGGLWLFAIPAFTVVSAVITCGSLHPSAQIESFAFFEMSRSLSLFGLAERFEALVCALVSVGWFSLLSLLLTCAGANFGCFFPQGEKTGVWLAALAATGMILGKMSIDSGLLCAMSALFWGFLPILTQGMGFQKKYRKK